MCKKKRISLTSLQKKRQVYSYPKFEFEKKIDKSFIFFRRDVDKKFINNLIDR